MSFSLAVKMFVFCCLYLAGMASLSLSPSLTSSPGPLDREPIAVGHAVFLLRRVVWAAPDRTVLLRVVPAIAAALELHGTAPAIAEDALAVCRMLAAPEANKAALACMVRVPACPAHCGTGCSANVDCAHCGTGRSAFLTVPTAW